MLQPAYRLRYSPCRRRGQTNLRTILHYLFPRGVAARRAIMVTTLFLTAAPAIAWAQTDEIQVYDAAIAEPGVFNIMWHQNFTPRGLKDPAFPGAIISD